MEASDTEIAFTFFWRATLVVVFLIVAFTWAPFALIYGAIKETWNVFISTFYVIRDMW